MGRFFEVFLFEDLPASGRRADDVYLKEVDRCDVYLGLLGNEYGYEDAKGLSPTEREFDRATAKGKERLIFVNGAKDSERHPKMRALVRKAGAQLIRRRFAEIPDLTHAVYASLVDHLESVGAIQNRPFDERPCPDATLDDIDERAVADFVRLARAERQFPLAARAPKTTSWPTCTCWWTAAPAMPLCCSSAATRSSSCRVPKSGACTSTVRRSGDRPQVIRSSRAGSSSKSPGGRLRAIGDQS